MPDETTDATWDRIDCRLVVLDWPADPSATLVHAVAGFVTFEQGNPPPALLRTAGPGTVLTWRGHVTGGIVTLCDWLGPFLDEHGLTALASDARLEVLLCAGSADVHVSGPLRYPVRLDGDLWRAMLAAAAGPDDLAATVAREVFAGRGYGAEQAIIDRANRLALETGHPLGAAFTERIAQPPPGELDPGLVEEAAARLVVGFDPDDTLVESLVVCEFEHWRTDIHPPGFGSPAGQPFEAGYAWRVAQWETPPGAEPRLLALARPGLETVLTLLPTGLRRWALRMTRDAIELVATIAADEGHEEPWAAQAHAALVAQLEAAGGACGGV